MRYKSQLEVGKDVLAEVLATRKQIYVAEALELGQEAGVGNQTMRRAAKELGLVRGSERGCWAKPPERGSTRIQWYPAEESWQIDLDRIDDPVERRKLGEAVLEVLKGTMVEIKGYKGWISVAALLDPKKWDEEQAEEDLTDDDDNEEQ